MRVFGRLTLPQWHGGRRRLWAFAQLPGPPLGVAVSSVIVGAICIAVLVLVLSGRASDADARTRASSEAQSFAEHSAWLATGDAFGGYIQLLRDADDLEIRALDTPSDLRTAALRRVLELNTNRFDALAVVDLDGAVIAASDPSMLDAPTSGALAAVRANRGNANSDIVITEAGAFVDYASILADESGEQWAILVARARPDRLWQSTLAATIDNGRNVVINSAGQLAAGVPSSEVGQPWRGAEWTGGAIRAHPGGVDSVCALRAIARDTQIDHGWVVASCLPVATVLPSKALLASGAGIWALVAVIMVTALAGAALWYAARRLDLAVASTPAPESEPAPAEPSDTPVEAETPAPFGLPPQTIEARTVIEAYEARNARLATQVRESVQARLLVASSRLEEALAVVDEDPLLAKTMIERAAYEVDDTNERELRAMGQGLYPDLIRLGLPAALRALRKDVAGVIEVEVDADSGGDSLDADSERALSQEMRTVLYRFVLDVVEAIADTGFEECTVTLRRPDGGLWLAVKAHGGHPHPATAWLEVNRLAVEAYGGQLSLDVTDETVEVVAEFAGDSAQPYSSEAPNETAPVADVLTPPIPEADGPATEGEAA